jgi:superoxide dismutase, Fe-Mn family
MIKYEKRDYSKLKGMAGFSDKALELHLALYEGYVANINAVLESLEKMNQEGKAGTAEYAEIKRRAGWEFDGMRLHEYYFDGLGGNGKIDASGRLYKELEKNFGSFEAWKNDFLATAKMRGIGWAALYQDLWSGNFINFWINEHSDGHPAGLNLIFNLDVFEHAYLPDYGKDRAAYIEAYIKNVDWAGIEKRVK